MKSIVILGGGGFLAGYIQRHFAALGFRVISIGREATAEDGVVRHAWNLPHPEFAHMLAAEQPEICVNAAGRASVAASMVEPLADFETSTLLNFSVLDDLRRRSPKTAYVHLSSAAVYGDPASLPVREDAALAPISPYGWHKLMSETVLKEHTRQFGLRTASLRIFSAYGAGLRRQVVWELIDRALSRLNEPLKLQGRPDDSRDFIHAADVARAIELVVERGNLAGEAYNTASGLEVPMQQLAELVTRLSASRGGFAFDLQRRPGNPGRWHADIGRLRALGFAPSIDMETGVRAIIEQASAARG